MSKRQIIVNEVLLSRALFHLHWMVDTMLFQQAQTGLNTVDSPEIIDAKDTAREIIELLQGNSVGHSSPN